MVDTATPTIDGVIARLRKRGLSERAARVTAPYELFRLTGKSMVELAAERGYAIDPDFEKQHPRGKGEQGGWFVENPGASPPPEEGEAGISASREPSAGVLDVVRRFLTDPKTAKLREELTSIKGVQPTGAIGRWEDTVEPSFAVRWQDGQRVRGELVRLAKLYDQDSVLIWTNNAGKDVRMSMQFPTSPPPKLLDQLHTALTKAGIPGSSYMAAGREIIIYATEKDSSGVHQRLTSALKLLNLGGNIASRHGKFELILRDDYDTVINTSARTHAAALPEKTGEAMFLSATIARAMAQQMGLTAPDAPADAPPTPPESSENADQKFQKTPKQGTADFTLAYDQPHANG